jgi:hypothetical protein
MTKIKEMLEGPEGRMIGLRFTPEELGMVRGLIREQWLQRIEEADPGLVKTFEAIEMDRYHEFCHLLDHKSMWPKSRRILDHSAVQKIRTTSLIKTLEDEFGPFEISDEEDVGFEEMYWRLVRPDSASDVGPLHADAWFWELGHGKTPPGHKRVKVWVSIFSEPGKNGFKYVLGSHKKQWKHHGEERDGFVKPQIDEDEASLGAVVFESRAGDAIVFHDRLLHGGAPGGSSTRVSMEFTIFVNDANYFN